MIVFLNVIDVKLFPASFRKFFGYHNFNQITDSTIDNLYILNLVFTAYNKCCKNKKNVYTSFIFSYFLTRIHFIFEFYLRRKLNLIN